ncbi:very short patch repair endonuclease [Phascolarctobacterium sp.]
MNVLNLETTDKRSKIMKSIKSSDTNIEVMLRKALWHNGVRYRKNFKVFDCHPDIVITKYKIAIFCDGVFWHGKEMQKRSIKHNARYWNEKIRRNVERDLENTIELRDNGWIVLRFWEDDIQHDLNSCVSDVLNYILIRKRRIF